MYSPLFFLLLLLFLLLILPLPVAVINKYYAKRFTTFNPKGGKEVTIAKFLAKMEREKSKAKAFRDFGLIGQVGGSSSSSSSRKRRNGGGGGGGSSGSDDAIFCFIIRKTVTLASSSGRHSLGVES